MHYNGYEVIIREGYGNTQITLHKGDLDSIIAGLKAINRAIKDKED